MSYPEHIKEFARVRMEQTPNNTQICRDIKNKFQLEQEVECIRKSVSVWREKWNVQAKETPIKRLFCDIETGYYILKIRAWQLRNFQRYFNPDDIQQEKQILTISYKWQYEDVVRHFDIRMGEKEMLKEFVKIMGQADEIIAHNGDRFDVPLIRTRAIYYGVLMFPNYRTLDTLKKSRSSFLFASNKLDYISKYLGLEGKKEHEGKEMWKKIVEFGHDDNDYTEKDYNDALNNMNEYCDQDVITLEDTFFVLSPFITHNNNFAVLTGGKRWECPECASNDVKMHRTYSTPMGIIRREMKCNNCKKQYKISNKTYMNYLENITKIN